jgi:hypothetical protein
MPHFQDSSTGATVFNLISPAVFLSNCCILSSASASLSWQTFASRVPSSYLASKVSSGNSSDSIASTMASSFFNASSKGRLPPFPGAPAPALFAELDTPED